MGRVVVTCVIAAALLAVVVGGCGGGEETSSGSASAGLPDGFPPPADTPEAERNLATYNEVKGCLADAGFESGDDYLGTDATEQINLGIPPDTDFPDAEVSATLDYGAYEVSYAEDNGFALFAAQGDPTAAIAFGWTDEVDAALVDAIYGCAAETDYLLPPDASPELKQRLSGLDQFEPVN